MAHQSLYRRYRPRRFAEIKGQEHVVRALSNAVADDTVGHAYLFSGPRGTGKTSTARILAKALNCTNLTGGEPCCECESCVAMEAGGSFDLFELDAASNRGVDSVRDLVERTAVGSPGRTKVYILDEVHMLTKEASNALLKTLEEPPEHVRFVLATTDPQKVLPTIRSRTQHFDFNLLSAAELTDHVRWVVQDAGLDVDEEAIAHAVRRGRGSVRDTLSALDQVVAAGGVLQRSEPVEALFEAIAARDSGKALLAVAEAVNEGHDPRVLAEAFVAEVRDAFLVSLGVDTPHLIDSDAQRLEHWVGELGPAGLTSSLERVGTALVDMRSAADPRVPLEVALVQLTSTSDAGTSSGGSARSADSSDALADLVKRIERLEAGRPAPSSPAAPEQQASQRRATREAGRPTEQTPRQTPEQPTEQTPEQPTDGAAAAPAPSAAPQPTPEVPSGSSPRSAPPPEAPGEAPQRPRPPASPPRSGRKKPPPPPPRRRGATRQGAPAAAAPTTAPGPDAGPEPASVEPVADAAAGTASEVQPVAAEPVVPGSVEAGSVEAGSSATRSVSASSGELPDRESLVLAFGDVVVPQLKGIAKALYSAGRFVSVDDRGAVFALDNQPTRDRAEKYRSEIESKLSDHFGVAVGLTLVAEDDAAATTGGGEVGAPMPAAAPAQAAPAAAVAEADVPAPANPRPARPTPRPAPSTPRPAPRSEEPPTADRPGPDEPVDLTSGGPADSPGDEDLTAPVEELEDADVSNSGVERVTAAFPGAELIDTEDPK